MAFNGDHRRGSVQSWMSRRSAASSNARVLAQASHLDWKEVTLQVCIVSVPLLVIALLTYLTLSQAGTTKDKTLQLQQSLFDGIKISLIMGALQEEEVYTCAYLAERTMSGDVYSASQFLQQKRLETDRLIDDAEQLWIASGLTDAAQLRKDLNEKRLVTDSELDDCDRVVTIFKPLLDQVLSSVIKLFGQSEEGETCQLIGAFQTMILAKEPMSQRTALGSAYFATGQQEQHGSMIGLLDFAVTAFNRFDVTQMDKQFALANPDENSQRLLFETALLYKNASSADAVFYSAEHWRDVLGAYRTEVETIEESMRLYLINRLQERADQMNERFMLIIGLVSAVLVCCPALAMVYAVYASTQRKKVANVAQRMREQNVLLDTERQKTTQLLDQLLPRSISEQLRAGKALVPEAYDAVSVLQMDVVGFTPLCSKSTPLQIVALLNTLFHEIDTILEMHDCYKVETVGDAVVVASGVPVRNQTQHSQQVASIALSFLQSISQMDMPHIPGEHPLVRIGIHTAPAIAGVVGLKSPKYCLFAMRIQLTSASAEHIMKHHPEYTCAPRGEIDVKGKGSMSTYWLMGAQNHAYEVDFDQADHKTQLFKYNKRD